MDRQKTVGPPLILRDVVPESAEGRPREQHISSTIEQVVESSTHLVQRASRVEGGEKKVEVRANVDLLTTDPFSGDGEGKQCSKWGKFYFQAYDSGHIPARIAVAPIISTMLPSCIIVKGTLILIMSVYACVTNVGYSARGICAVQSSLCQALRGFVCKRYPLHPCTPCTQAYCIPLTCMRVPGPVYLFGSL